MPKISIVIPAYNTEKYLPKCLDSVLAQTFLDWEAICVNDGSLDNSAQILEEYAERDSRIKIINQPNKGQSAARNNGLNMVTGEWIYFLDSDDALPENTLQCLYDIAQKTGVLLVASRSRFSMNEKGETNSSVKNNLKEYCLKTNGLKDFVQDPKIFSSPGNKLFHKSLFEKLRFPEGMIFEDWPVMTIVFSKVASYAVTEEACYIYRESNISTTRSAFTRYKVDCYMSGIHIVYDAFKGTKDLKYARKRISVAVKMVVNKVFHSKDKELSNYTAHQIKQLFDDNIVCLKDLSFKTRWRLWRLKHQ